MALYIRNQKTERACYLTSFKSIRDDRNYDIKSFKCLSPSKYDS